MEPDVIPYSPSISIIALYIPLSPKITLDIPKCPLSLYYEYIYLTPFYGVVWINGYLKFSDYCLFTYF
jgi:hypothetical protein